VITPHKNAPQRKKLPRFIPRTLPIAVDISLNEIIIQIVSHHHSTHPKVTHIEDIR
jgi:hypothetical protein